MNPPTQAKKKKSPVLIIVLVVLAVLAVPCIGSVVAIGIPSFHNYVQRSKTQEASAQLTTLFRLSASYYETEHIGPNGELLTACAVGSGRTSNTPGPQKTVIDVEPGSPFEALGWSALDPIYYQYEIVGVGGCGHGPGENLYTFRAHGDLDGDGVRSLFELAAGTDAQNTLLRVPGVYRENELE